MAAPLNQMAGEIQARGEQRDDYIGAISHDLRTPLTLIRGHAQLLQRALVKADPRRQNVEAILTGTRQMSAMIQDLVDSACLEARQLRLDKQPVDMKTFIRDLLAGAAGIVDVARVEEEVAEDLPRSQRTETVWRGS